MTEEREPPPDAILIVSFGGPEGPEDVMPFLERVTRGRGVPRARLEEVAEHYHHLGGRSPINDHCRALIAALRVELDGAGISLPIYWGNRNWDPLLEDTVAEMQQAGVQRALAFTTSAFSSYSGCRQYREDIAKAITATTESLGGAPVIDKLRVFYNHPDFLEAVRLRVQAVVDEIPPARRDGVRLAFTAHSIPLRMADGCDYVTQLEEAAEWIAKTLEIQEWQLVYQSRSGPPQVPWLEPDISDHLSALGRIGANDVIVVPLGFLSDHVEVIWDLDHEAAAAAEAAGIQMWRAETVGTHPLFVGMIRQLIEERLEPDVERRVLPGSRPRPDVCAPGCCAYTPRGRPSGGGKPGAPGRPSTTEG